MTTPRQAVARSGDDAMISRLVNGVLGLSGGAAYLIVGVLAFAEAAAFTGLVVPGEVAVLLGGVLAS
jgi:undecaprenyl-diphosphatase